MLKTVEYRVRAEGLPNDVSRANAACLAVARALEVSTGEARVLLMKRPVLPRGLAEPAARELARSLSASGLRAEVISLPSGGQTVCVSHPSLSPEAMCSSCRGSICALCVLQQQGGRCAACHSRQGRSRRAQRLRVLALLVLFAIAVATLVQVRQARASRGTLSRPLAVSVVLLTGGALPEETLIAWRDGLSSLEGWLSAEAERYGAYHTPFARFHLHGPLPAAPPPRPPTDPGWWARASHAFRHWRAIRAIDAAAQVDAAADVRLYVALEPGGQSLRTVEGVAELGGTTGVVRAPERDDDLTLALVAVAHELLHTLGASDKYDEAGRARDDTALADPDADPLYPQSAAEVMVGEVAIGPREGRLPTSWEEVRIGAATAREIGWLPR